MEYASSILLTKTYNYDIYYKNSNAIKLAKKRK